MTTNVAYKGLIFLTNPDINDELFLLLNIALLNGI